MIASAEEFVRLRTSVAPDEYRRAAHDEAPMAVWFDVIARFPAMKEWVAHNKTIPLEILDVLARDADVRVRATVAARRKLAVEQFELLAADPHETVRHAVACNGKVPPQVLQRLATDGAALVSAAAERRLRQARPGASDDSASDRA